MLPDGVVTEIQAPQFEAAVLQHDRAVLVDFYSTTCGPCRMMSPWLGALAEVTKGDLRIVKLNIAGAQDVVRAFNVQRVPTLILFFEGEIVRRRDSAPGSPDALHQWVAVG